MNQTAEQALQNKFARIAGFSYVLFTVTGLTFNFFLNAGLSDPDVVQASGIFQNEMQFRMSAAAEAIMFLAVLMASVSFYIVLKPVNKPMALTALCLRLVEIIIGSMAVVVSMGMLAISSRASLLEQFDPEQIRTIVNIALSFKQPAYEYSWIFMGFAGVITFCLFFNSRYLPRAWSVWGIVTYTSLILYPFARLLIPDLPREAQFVLFPGALFELGVGFSC